MDPSSPSGCTPDRTDSGPVHPCRSDVLLHQFERATAETGLTFEDFAERLAECYVEQVPEHARAVAIAPPSGSNARAMVKELENLRSRVRRYVRGTRFIPVDLEEAWAYALPEPYSTRARQELARRYGFIGAERVEAPGCSDAGLIPALCKESGEAISAIGQGLADGRIDAADLERAPSMIRELDDLIAAATSARAAVVERTGYREPSLSVVEGRSA